MAELRIFDKYDSDKWVCALRDSRTEVIRVGSQLPASIQWDWYESDDTPRPSETAMEAVLDARIATLPPATPTRIATLLEQNGYIIRHSEQDGLTVQFYVEKGDLQGMVEYDKQGETLAVYISGKGQYLGDGSLTITRAERDLQGKLEYLFTQNGYKVIRNN